MIKLNVILPSDYTLQVNDGSRMAVYGALSVFSLELGEDVSLRTSF